MPKKKSPTPAKPATASTKPKRPKRPKKDVVPLDPSIAPVGQVVVETLGSKAPLKPARKTEPTTPLPVEEAEELPAFSELELLEPVARAIKEMGFETPTPIQAKAIPVLMEGHDLIGQAQTGTGKTAAFGIPLIHKVDPRRRETQAIVMAPTRELAVQVAKEIYEFSKFTGMRVVPIYGGQPIDRQFRALAEGAPIVVGTPGRILDHLRRGSLKLDEVRFCALDEADEMLALGFLEEIEGILALLPEECQRTFFSATMPPRILALMRKYLRDPKHIAIESKQRTLDTTNQAYYEVLPGQKFEALVRILDMETPGPTIIFCRTRQETNDLAEALHLRGYGAAPLHGDMSQSERERVLRRFRDEQCDMLVATDVAARGLDIDTVTHVINFDIPFDVEQYIHRIGRTGRAGRTGDAITLVQGRERRQLRNIEQMIGATIKPVRLPTAYDIAARRREQFKESLREALEVGGFDGHIATVEELCLQHDPVEVAATALHLLWQSQHPRTEVIAQEIEVASEQPERGMTRLFVGIGRRDGLRPGDLVGAIANQVGISGRDIGAIDILDDSSYVEVPSRETDAVIEALRRSKLRGKKANVQVARPFDAR